jgi:hypothetical protein
MPRPRRTSLYQWLALILVTTVVGVLVLPTPPVRLGCPGAPGRGWHGTQRRGTATAQHHLP